jgi:hypothetical protein
VHCAVPGSSRQQKDTKRVVAQLGVSICQPLLRCHDVCQQ